MAYYQFGPDDIVFNILKANPRVQFYVYQNAVFFNNRPEILGDRSNSNINGVPAGYISLYELNVDRTANDLIYPFITKNGSLTTFSTMSTREYNSDFQYGDTITGSYPLSASISKDYFTQGQSRIKVDALQNTLNYYSAHSPHYQFSSSLGDKSDQELGLISIPSIFYGSKIEKGTVELNFYISGTLAAQLKDVNKNGELIQVSGTANDLGSDYGSGSVAGVVLYNEGFVVLTGSWDLDPDHTEAYTGGSPTNPKWSYFARGANDGTSTSIPSSSYGLKFSGSTETPVMTMFANADRGMLNFSNNPTFLSHSQSTSGITSSYGYQEPTNVVIKNTVSGAFSDYNESFKKQTFVSKIGIYDEDMNLIAVAKLATPVKKTEERDLTFKLKLDI